MPFCSKFSPLPKTLRTFLVILPVRGYSRCKRRHPHVGYIPLFLNKVFEKIFCIKFPLHQRFLLFIFLYLVASQY